MRQSQWLIVKKKKKKKLETIALWDRPHQLINRPNNRYLSIHMKYM